MTKQKTAKILRCAAVVLVFVLVGSVAMLLLDMWDSKQGLFRQDEWYADKDTVYLDGVAYEPKDYIETLLVMGLDKFDGAAQTDSYNNNRQADFLMLYVFDNKNHTCTAIHINRDTMAEMNVLGVAGNKVDTITQQLALAHTYGNGREMSCRNVANAVSKLLMGIPVDHYVSVTMDAVADYADLLDGVTVTVLDDFTGIDDTLVKGQEVTLRGEHALRYVRTRYGLEDSTNETRMTRQRQFLEAAYEKTQQCIDTRDGFVAEACLRLAEHIVSDRSGNQLQTYLERIASYDLEGIRSIEGKSKLGEEHIEFYPDSDALIRTVIELFYQQKK